MADFLSLPNSVLAFNIFKFFPIEDLLTFRTVSKSLKSRVDNIFNLRLEYLTKELSEAVNFQLPNDLKHLGASTMQAAISKLNSIHPTSVTQLKTFVNPPNVLKEVMELVHTILTSNPKTPPWTDICRDVLHLNILNDLANYGLKPMEFSIFQRAENHLSRIDSKSVRAFSTTAEVFAIWCESVIAVNRMYYQDDNGKAYFENEQRKESIRKEMRIIDNLANVSTKMKNNTSPAINQANTIKPTKQAITSTSKPVGKASTSNEETKQVKEKKKPSPAKPLSKLIKKPVSKTPNKPSTQGIESLMISPAMNLRSNRNKK